MGNGASFRITGSKQTEARLRAKETARERRSVREQDEVHGEDSRVGRRPQERGAALLRGDRERDHLDPQGRSGGPDNGLRQVLRQGAEGPRGRQSPNRGEDAYCDPQGPRLQRGQRPQRIDLETYHFAPGVCPGCVPRGLRPRTEVRWTTLQEGHLAATRPDKFLLMFRFRDATGPWSRTVSGGTGLYLSPPAASICMPIRNGPSVAAVSPCGQLVGSGILHSRAVPVGSVVVNLIS